MCWRSAGCEHAGDDPSRGPCCCCCRPAAPCAVAGRGVSPPELTAGFPCCCRRHHRVRRARRAVSAGAGRRARAAAHGKVEPAQRLATLSQCSILKLPGVPPVRGVRTADRALLLARELAALMDEASAPEIFDLHEALQGVVESEYAEHWQKTPANSSEIIISRAWPDCLAEQRPDEPGRAAGDPVAGSAQADSFRQPRRAPPRSPVWVAGTTGAIPAVARLLRVIAGLPNGHGGAAPGWTTDLADEVWDRNSTKAHPQSGLAAPADPHRRQPRRCGGVGREPGPSCANAGGMQAAAGGGAGGMARNHPSIEYHRL